ncbi:alpha/beta fold hydrolase [Stutzerimonas tarimensis]|uniref:Alpha/beta fold hydrolase n=1 Tax=Stutzerimonas tarimensis TaxID=1507735 RepID=A0ABV7T445_9GAMM
MPSFLIRSAVAMAASAAYLVYRQHKTEEECPPTGQFVEVEGVRLHYTEKGSGRPLVLLHGAATMGVDFELSGLLDKAAGHYRVIVFDRPGYGHSDRPVDRPWDPTAQARLFHGAFRALGIERPLVLGHSWGAMLAVALGLDYPESVSGLVLAGGYFYPVSRPEMMLAQQPSIPVVSDLMRHTITPWLVRAAWPMLIKRVFAPGEVPARFNEFPTWMALRSSSLQAASDELGLLISSATALSPRYGELKVPTTIIVGREDALLPMDKHSAQLHAALPEADYRELEGVGHMLHYQATDAVLDAIDSVAVKAESSIGTPPAMPPSDPLADGPRPDA